MIEPLKGWKKHAAYAALFLAAFALALRQTFPAQAVEERVILEAAAQGWQVKVADASPAGFLGVRFDGVTLESREGARVPIEELRATLRLRSLLLARRGVDFDVRLYEGRLAGTIEEARGVRRVAARLQGIDLTRATALRKALGVDLGGTAEGTVDVTLDARDPARSTGSLSLRVEKASLLGGQVSIPSLGGALTLPRADVGTLVAQATLHDGKATFEKLEVKGPDVEVAGEGLAVTLHPRLASSALFGRARARLQDGFWQRSGNQALKSVAEMALAPARGRDGAYHFQIFGTLAAPQARPAPQ